MGVVNGEYAAFLASKAIRAKERGMHDVPALAAHLFPFQHHCVEFNLRAGSSGLFLDTGMGKTEVQLEWCQKIIEAENRPALILTPLAVAGQFKRRADRWGYEARVIREQSDVRSGINICNYDRIDKLDPSQFGAVALDEASILKSFSGKTTRKLIDLFKGLRFKLAATATPAPNDHIELGNYAEFLDVMAVNEMLSRFFINDASTASHEWRLKGHATTAFYDWMASWSRMAEKPSDLGDKDDGFILPPFQVVRHRARESHISRDLADMFGAPALSATTIYEIKRQTSEARAELAASIVEAEPDKVWLIWVDTDNEGDAMQRALPHATEVRGSQSADEKEEKLEAFSCCKIRQFISKPSLSGFGMDWSHCARMVFVGRTYSYETWYQAVRRCWRFGQKEQVVIHLVVAEGESEIGRVIDRKAGDHIDMKIAMRGAMKRNNSISKERMVSYQPLYIGRLPTWITMRNGGLSTMDTMK